MREFNKQTVRQVAQEIQEVLNKHGFTNIEFSNAGARYESAECTFKIKGTVVGVEGVQTYGNRLLERYADEKGLSLEKNARGEQLVDYKPRNHKYPFIYQTARGARYKTTLDGARGKFSI